MTTRNSSWLRSLGLVLGLALVLLPATALARPGRTLEDCTTLLEALEALPAPHIVSDEALPAELEQLERDIKKLQRASTRAPAATQAALASLLTRVERLQSRDSALHFLSVNEVERLAQVERFEVAIAPMLNDPTPKHLASACDSLAKEVTKIKGPGSGGAALQAEISGGADAKLSAAIQALQATDKDATLAEIVAVAEQLAIIGRDSHQLCRKISAGMLDSADIELLRAIYRNDAHTILRYQHLLARIVAGKTVADLVAVLLHNQDPNNPDVQAAEAGLLAALTVDVTGEAQALVSPVGLGSMATTAFEGLAEFLIDRAKEEALNYVRDNLVAQVCGSDLGVFIPKTCELMANLDSGMALSSIGTMLHASVLDDLELMPDRLLVVAWMRSPDVAPPATLVRVALPLLAQARLRKNPLEYAASIYAMPATDCERLPAPAGSGDDRCAETLAYLRVASALLRATATNVDRSSTRQTARFSSLGAAFEFERLFAKIPASARERLKRQLPAPGLQWSDDATLSFTGANGDHEPLSRVLAQSISLAANLTQAIDELGKTSQLTGQSTATPQGIQAAARATLVGLVELARAVIELDPALAGSSHYQALFAHSDQLITMSDRLGGEDWGRAALAMFELVAKVVATPPEAGSPDDQASANLRVVIDKLGRYLPLFIEIANAKSSADVKATLEAAFPAGGYRLKFRQPAVALNAFLGGYGGGTRLFGPAPQLTGEAAMFAPIGVEVSWPVKRARKASHLGFLVSVVDLGAITTAKFLETEVADPPTDDTGADVDGEVSTTEEPAKFNLAGLLAPGAYFTVGVAESPFSFGLGASVSPFVLQQVDRSYIAGEVDAQSQRYLTALRFGAFVAVDITMIAFGRKHRRLRP